MRRQGIVQACRERLQPRRWGALALVLGLLASVRVLLGDVALHRELPHLARGLLLVATLVALTPIPWQWTGDARKRAPFPRGLLQAVLFNAVWLAIVMALFAPGRPFYVHPYGPGSDPVVAALHRAIAERTGFGFHVAPLVLLHPLAVGLGWAIALLQEARAERAEALAAHRILEGTARAAQEQALKAQLDPHVLYNALGGLSELVREDPGRAEQGLLALADLYRELTLLGRRSRITLGEERALLEDYLALEQLRLGDRLRVAWDWPGDLDALELPPLLVQPLVENAIKHGVAARREGGGLRLSVSREGRRLRIAVANEGPPLLVNRTAGTGLSNLRARLALLGEGARLDLRRDGDWTVAGLELDLDLPGEAP